MLKVSSETSINNESIVSGEVSKNKTVLAPDN